MNVFQIDIVYGVWKTGLRGVETGDGERVVEGRCALVHDSTVLNGCTAPEVIPIMVQRGAESRGLCRFDGEIQVVITISYQYLSV